MRWRAAGKCVSYPPITICRCEGRMNQILVVSVMFIALLVLFMTSYRLSKARHAAKRDAMAAKRARFSRRKPIDAGDSDVQGKKLEIPRGFGKR